MALSHLLTRSLCGFCTLARPGESCSAASARRIIWGGGWACVYPGAASVLGAAPHTRPAQHRRPRQIPASPIRLQLVASLDSRDLLGSGTDNGKSCLADRNHVVLARVVRRRRCHRSWWDCELHDALLLGRKLRLPKMRLQQPKSLGWPSPRGSSRGSSRGGGGGVWVPTPSALSSLAAWRKGGARVRTEALEHSLRPFKPAKGEDVIHV